MRVGSSYNQICDYKKPFQKRGYLSVSYFAANAVANTNLPATISFTALQKVLSAKKISKFVNEISRDRLELHLKKLTAPEMEGRAVGHPGIERAKEYIAEQFKDIGLDPVEKLGLKDFYHNYKTPRYETAVEEHGKLIEGQAWCKLSGEDIDTSNVIGMIKGHKYPNDYLILSAHYDHLGKSADGIVFPGADDNASSVSAMIEIARALKHNKNEKSVIFVATSGEEKYKSGAHNLYKALKKAEMTKNVEIIDIEMLGAQSGNSLDIFKYKTKWTQKMVESLQEACNFMGIRAKTQIPDPRKVRNNAEAFTQENLPAVCIAWDFYGKNTHPFYHTSADTFESINMDVLERAAKTVGVGSYIHSNKTPFYAAEKPKVISTIQNIFNKKEPQNVA